MFNPPIITVPWASQGDTVAIPTGADPNGFVSFTTGYTQDYEISLKSGNPKAKAVERRVQNQLFSVFSQNIQAWQQSGLPAWYSNMPGGYNLNAMVVRQNPNGSWAPFRSLTNNNISDSNNSTTWQYIEFSSETLSHIPMPTGGGSGTGIISSAIDFNLSFTGSGTWFIQNDGVAQASPNCPSSQGGMIEHRQWNDGSNIIKIQRYSDRSNFVYSRGAVNSNWSAWREVLNRRGDSVTGDMTFTANILRNNQPPAFDYGTAVPNTKWVRDYIAGNYSRRIALGGTTSLQDDIWGAVVQNFGGTGTTFTMPPASATIAAASKVRIYNDGSDVLTITVYDQVNQKFWYGSASKSISLQKGDTVEISKASGTDFDITGGTWLMSVSDSVVPTRASADRSGKIANTEWVGANFVSNISPKVTPDLTITAPSTNDANLLLDSPAGRYSQVVYRRAGSPTPARWAFSMDAAAETGGNVGSDMRLTAFGDNGSSLQQVFVVKRATGVLDFLTPPTVQSSPVHTQATLNKVSQLTNDVPYVARGRNAGDGDGPNFGNLMVTGTGNSALNQQGLHVLWNERGDGAGSLINNHGGGAGGITIRDVNSDNTVENFRWDFQSDGTLRRAANSGRSSAVINDVDQGMTLFADGNIWGVRWGNDYLWNYLQNNFNARAPNGATCQPFDSAEFGPIRQDRGVMTVDAPDTWFLKGLRTSQFDSAGGLQDLYLRCTRIRNA